MKQPDVMPFVKWAGGKRQLLTQIRERMPEQYNRYFEPFVGGGAVYFDLCPEKAVLGDVNASLVNAYLQIKEAPEEFLVQVEKLDREIAREKKAYYYKAREWYNDKLMRAEFDMELAALFVFLNKHCFNGLYRVNGKGLFNVPYNNSIRKSCSREGILAVSRTLKTAKIQEADFQTTCRTAQKGDFIFIDSPYAPLKTTSFEAYTKEGFDMGSHRRLAGLFAALTKRGCYCMLTNHNTEFIQALYQDFDQEVVDVKRMINSDAGNRVGQEVIITNYRTNVRNK